MSKIEIKTSKEQLANKKINLPLDGEVQIGEDLCVEVSEECANLMVEMGSGWSFKDKQKEVSEEDKANLKALRKKYKELFKESEFAVLRDLALSLKLRDFDKEGYKKATTQPKLFAFIVKYITDEQLLELEKDNTEE